jgi:hypothetical protein
MSLDTRCKILTLEQASALPSPVVAFVSHLEVLRSSHVIRLQEIAARNLGKLAVVLTDPDSPLVPLQARAELTAALRVVDYVIPSPGGASPALAALRPTLVVDDEEEDRERTRLLIEHVRSRSRI